MLSTPSGTGNIRKLIGRATITTGFFSGCTVGLSFDPRSAPSAAPRGALSDGAAGFFLPQEGRSDKGIAREQIRAVAAQKRRGASFIGCLVLLPQSTRLRSLCIKKLVRRPPPVVPRERESPPGSGTSQVQPLERGNS